LTFSFFFFSYSADYGRKRRDVSASQELPFTCFTSTDVQILTFFFFLFQLFCGPWEQTPRYFRWQRASSSSAQSPPPPSSGTQFSGFTGTNFTGFTGTKSFLHICSISAPAELWYSLYWLYWYKSTYTDAKGAARLLVAKGASYGHQNTKAPLIAITIGSAAHLLLDYLFIIHLNFSGLFFLISLFFLKRCASYILIFQVSFFFHLSVFFKALRI
jgi:hypothetical protein